METVHLRVNEGVYEHVMWLLKQFDPKDVEIISDEFLKNKSELDEELRRMDAGETTFISLEEFEKETDELLKRYED